MHSSTNAMLLPRAAMISFSDTKTRLSDEGAGGGGLVSPGRGKGTDGLVVAGETVDAGLDQDQAELAVLVLAVALEVLADSDGLAEESANGHGKITVLGCIEKTLAFLMSM